MRLRRVYKWKITVSCVFSEIYKEISAWEVSFPIGGADISVRRLWVSNFGGKGKSTWNSLSRHIFHHAPPHTSLLPPRDDSATSSQPSAHVHMARYWLLCWNNSNPARHQPQHCWRTPRATRTLPKTQQRLEDMVKLWLHSLVARWKVKVLGEFECCVERDFTPYIKVMDFPQKLESHRRQTEMSPARNREGSSLSKTPYFYCIDH